MKKGSYFLVDWGSSILRVSEARKLSLKMSSLFLSTDKLIIFPPAIFISETKRVNSGKKNIFWGSSNISFGKNFEYDGGALPSMLRDLGVKFVLIDYEVGDEEGVRRKIKTSISAGLRAILVVGERKRDNSGHYLREVRDKIRNSIAGVNKELLRDISIVYRPAFPLSEQRDFFSIKDISGMIIFIRKILTDICGRKMAFDIPIFYGGYFPKEDMGNILDVGVSGFFFGQGPFGRKNIFEVIKFLQKNEK